jgi:hypothetical protein
LLTPPVPQDHQSIFDIICDTEGVRPVNHGEFETTTNAVFQAVESKDMGASDRVYSLAIQRCRRGGKTFMLHAVAAAISQDKRKADGTIVVNISLNDGMTFVHGEDAVDAILMRVAFALSGRPNFGEFEYNHEGFTWGQVYTFIVQSKIVLLIDELNKISHTAPSYAEMSRLLSDIHGRMGSAVLFSTHKRDTADLLWGRKSATIHLSIREHTWLSIPRIENENCLKGMKKHGAEQLFFWCAVLRGRMPSLLLLNQRSLTTFAEVGPIFELYEPQFGSTPEDYANFQAAQTASRKAALKAVISGDIGLLPRERNTFAAYSNMRTVAALHGLPSWSPRRMCLERTSLFCVRFWKYLRLMNPKRLKLWLSCQSLSASSLRNSTIWYLATQRLRQDKTMKQQNCFLLKKRPTVFTPFSILSGVSFLRDTDRTCCKL